MIHITDEMVDAALDACPLNYFQPTTEGGTHFHRCSVNTDDIRLMLEAAFALVPHPPEGGKEAGEPVVYVSSKQLPHNPEHAYIACRIQPEGNFDTPLYRSPILARDTARAEGEAKHYRSALLNMVHTFTEDSHGNTKTLPASDYQKMARQALDVAALAAPVSTGDTKP